jgi:hypothetical protein
MAAATTVSPPKSSAQLGRPRFVVTMVAERSSYLVGNAVVSLHEHPEQTRWLREHPERLGTSYFDLRAPSR